jgi:hypothetical protein
VHASAFVQYTSLGLAGSLGYTVPMPCPSASSRSSSRLDSKATILSYGAEVTKGVHNIGKLGGMELRKAEGMLVCAGMQL